MSLTIADIQRTTDEAVRQGAIAIHEMGGADALDGYLNRSLCNLLGVAINEQGTESACELMLVGLAVAEKFQGDTRGRCQA
jgi:hypothetical protein